MAHVRVQPLAERADVRGGDSLDVRQFRGLKRRLVANAQCDGRKQHFGPHFLQGSPANHWPDKREYRGFADKAQEQLPKILPAGYVVARPPLYSRLDAGSDESLAAHICPVAQV
jgi:hypothetical protein